MERKDLGDLNVGVVRLDWLEWPANFRGGIGLHVPRVQLARGAEIENQDNRLLVVALGYRAQRLQGGEFRKRQPQRAQRANLKEVAPRDAVTGGNRTFSTYLEHVWSFELRSVHCYHGTRHPLRKAKIVFGVHACASEIFPAD